MSSSSPLFAAIIALALIIPVLSGGCLASSVLLPKTEHPIRDPQGSVAGLTVKYRAFMGESETSVVQGFSTKGPDDGRNGEYLEAVEELAVLYHLSKEHQYARRVALILNEFARVSRKWPVTSRVGDPPKPLAPDWQRIGDGMGRVWSTWFYYDLGQIVKLSRAYDLIYQSGALEELGKETDTNMKQILENYFEYWWMVYTVHWAPYWSNMGPARLEYMLMYAESLGRPEWIRQSIRWIDNLFYRGFFRDGFWHEGTPSYHNQVLQHMKRLLPMLQGYTDPPGYIDPVEGNRVESFDAAARWGDFLKNADVAVNALRLPDGRYTTLNDTHYADKGAPIDESRPQLLPALGYAILGTGYSKQQTQVHLNFASPFGHEHKDGLGLLLYSNGVELLSEGEYKGNRAWQSSTAAHNTVVVDERDQYTRSRGKQIAINWGDRSVPIEDWLSIHAKNGNIANLLAYDVSTESAMVVEAEAQGLYGYPVAEYQRTISMISRPGQEPYVFDVFRVAGGQKHDWMVHGPLQQEYGISSNVDLLPQAGTLSTYITNLESGSTDSAIKLNVRTSTGQGNLITMVASPKQASEVIVGKGPAMRRPGEADYAAIRRTNSQDVFVAVHNPYQGEAPNLKVTPLLTPVDAHDPAAVKVEGEGFRDVLVSSDEAPNSYSVHQVGELAISGRFAWLRFTPSGELTEALLVGGGFLKVGDQVLQADPDRLGKVVGAGRAADGAEGNYFDVEGSLPQGTELAGRLINLTLSDDSRNGYTIQSVAQHGKLSRVYVTEDTALVWHEGEVQQVFFPNRTLSDSVSYEILGRLHYLGRQATLPERISRQLIKIGNPDVVNSREVSGNVQLGLDVSARDRRQVTTIKAAVDGEVFYASDRDPQPGEVKLDTLKYNDGDHQLQITVVDDQGVVAQRTVSLHVSNWWSFLDELQPPIITGFFGEVELHVRGKSSGWEAVTDDAATYLDDKDRRRRSSNTTEYLMWQTPHLKQFSATLYSPEPDVSDVVAAFISSDGVTWEKAQAQLREEEAAPGIRRWTLSGQVSEQNVKQFKLTLFQTEPGKDVQVGEVKLKGLN